MSDFLLFTCEHGGNRVPARWAHLFRGHKSLLKSHRGYDPGSLQLARVCARRLRAPLYFATVTRLLVELNRSLGHRSLFSAITAPLPAEDRASLLERYYFPYRNRVEATAERAIAEGRRVIHLSFHTFTPNLDGRRRRSDVGLLYDPARPKEAEYCVQLRDQIRRTRPDLITRRNYPYLGTADGFPTALRRRWKDSEYIGVELELNQRWPLGPPRSWRRLLNDFAGALASLHKGRLEAFGCANGGGDED